MANYFLFALRSDSHSDPETIYEKNVSSYTLSFDMFYSLVGKCTSSFSKCSVECFDTLDSPYLRKMRILCGDVRIYIYLQKLS